MRWCQHDVGPGRGVARYDSADSGRVGLLIELRRVLWAREARLPCVCTTQACTLRVLGLQQRGLYRSRGVPFRLKGKANKSELPRLRGGAPLMCSFMSNSTVPTTPASARDCAQYKHRSDSLAAGWLVRGEPHTNRCTWRTCTACRDETRFAYCSHSRSLFKSRVRAPRLVPDQRQTWAAVVGMRMHSLPPSIGLHRAPWRRPHSLTFACSLPTSTLPRRAVAASARALQPGWIPAT